VPSAIIQVERFPEATMADIGDWLLVRARTDHLHSRRGRIMETRGSKGGPPYLVQWLDTGAQALVFPGPDAQVMTEAELQVLDQRQNQRWLTPPEKGTKTLTSDTGV
jgi:hypothetical protein